MSVSSRREQKFPVSIKRGSVEVKIYQTRSHGCESYILAYYLNGKRKRRVFSKFELAKNEAEIVAGRLGSANAGFLTLSGADLAAYQRARQHLDPSGIAIEIAAAEFSDAKKKLGDVPISQAVEFFLKRHPKQIEARSVQCLVDEFIATKETDGLSARYVESLHWALPKFTSAFRCNIGDVTAPDVDNWLRQTGLAPRTRNNLRSAVLTLFNFAKARRYLPRDYDELTDVPLAKDRGGKIEVFTPSELEEIFGCTGERLTPFIALGAFAGIRHAEIQRLDWRDVRFDDGIIEIHAAKAKTASRRTAPILDNLQKWLIPAKQSSGLVCPYRNVAVELHLITKRINLKRRAIWAQSNNIPDSELERIDQLLRGGTKTPKKRGLQKGEVPPGTETAQIEGWTPFAWKHNAMRHSFISYRIAVIKNVAQVALEAGNSPQVIFSNYKELVRPADAEKWFSIAPITTEDLIQLPPIEVDAKTGTTLGQSIQRG